MAVKRFLFQANDLSSKRKYDEENIVEQPSPALDTGVGSKSPRGDTALNLFLASNNTHEEFDLPEERKLVQKIDVLILSNLAICYMFFYLDKTTLSYAAIFGIRKDLHLERTQYSWLSSLFYFGFLAWAVPTSLLMQRFPIGKYLAVNIFLWGFLLMLQATTSSFASLGALRALAGAAESCADPAFVLITTNGMGVAVGGLIGYGIGHIRGDLASWKYEFLIIGGLCCMWGFVIFFYLPDSPVDAKQFSVREQRIIVERKRADQCGVENKEFKLYQVVEAICDIKTYLFFTLAVASSVPNGGISNFGTLIIQGFGFSTLHTALMQIPYGVFVILCILACVTLESRFTNKRCLFVFLFVLPNIAGTFGLRYLDARNIAGRYICYLLTGSYVASAVMFLSLQTANTAGYTKKVVTTATLFVGYAAGNIAGPFFYLAEQAPKYELGIWSMIVSNLIEAIAVLVLWALMWRENRRRDGEQGTVPSAVDDRDLDATALADMTDRENPNFRYIY